MSAAWWGSGGSWIAEWWTQRPREGASRSGRRVQHSASITLASVALLALSGAIHAPDDVVFKAMRDELSRSMQRLRLDTLPAPYFIAYRFTESNGVDAAASFGSLVRSNENRLRTIQVELRVGDYVFDNTNFAGPGPSAGFAQAPLEDDYQEIRRQLWLATDNAYKAALEQIAQKRAALRNVTRTEDIPDFSREARDSVVDETVAPPVDRRAVEALVQDLSALFRQMPDVFNSSVTWSSGDTRVRYVNSEGTTFLRRSPWISIRVTGSTQAPDGASLEDVAVYYGSRLTELPGREALRAAVREMGGRLSRLRAAPVVDQYNGPVLFEDQAAAETFNQVLASRLVAARRPVSRSGAGQSGGPGENQFMDLIGGRVLPSFMSATDDPTRVEYRGQFIGGYRVDDDGVRSRATLLIDHGILKTLLNARVPVRGITQSTGNRWGGGTVVSNLLVTVEGGLNRADLRKKLLELATQRGKEYGIVVRRFANPTASTGLDLMAMMMAMSIGGPAGGGSVLRALEAYRVYLDGREELIRNADITGITAATFKEIVAASDSSVVYTAPFSPRGAFGPTGGYAASYVVPSILFEDIAVRGPRGEIPKPPVAKHPFFETP